MEHLLFWSKCSIFHNILKCMILQRRQKALLWGNELRAYRVIRSQSVFSETNQLEDPRQQWHIEQEQMLKDYLVTAQDDLEVNINNF